MSPAVLLGAVHVIVACESLPVALALLGALATPTGVTALDDVEAFDEPMALVATTLNVYAVPLARPPTVHDVTPVVQVAPPGLAVTV